MFKFLQYLAEGPVVRKVDKSLSGGQFGIRWITYPPLILGIHLWTQENFALPYILIFVSWLHIVISTRNRKKTKNNSEWGNTRFQFPGKQKYWPRKYWELYVGTYYPVNSNKADFVVSRSYFKDDTKGFHDYITLHFAPFSQKTLQMVKFERKDKTVWSRRITH